MDGKADSEQVKLAKNILGINISKRNPLPIRLQDLLGANLIIVVANDIPQIMFNYAPVSLKNKIIFWNVKDEQMRNKKNIKKIISTIKRKVDKLNRRLGKK